MEYINGIYKWKTSMEYTQINQINKTNVMKINLNGIQNK